MPLPVAVFLTQAPENLESGDRGAGTDWPAAAAGAPAATSDQSWRTFASSARVSARSCRTSAMTRDLAFNASRSRSKDARSRATATCSWTSFLYAARTVAAGETSSQAPIYRSLWARAPEPLNLFRSFLWAEHEPRSADGGSLARRPRALTCQSTDAGAAGGRRRSPAPAGRKRGGQRARQSHQREKHM